MSLVPGSAARPIVWTIAGSDSCGGGGIQADLKTLTALGAHACTVIASITAQNSEAVRAILPTASGMVAAQIVALKDDMPPRAVKLGMLGDAAGIEALVEILKELDNYVVYDPVLISSSGTKLLDFDARNAAKEKLLPDVDLLTPNIHEAEFLSGLKIKSDEDVEKAAGALLALGPSAVIIKGWSSGQDFAQDFYSNGTEKFWLASPKRAGATSRGTGCTFSSSLAAAHAFGFNEADAAVIAKAYVNKCLRLSKPIGRGMPILSHEAWPPAPEDMPWLTSTAAAGRKLPAFPDCGQEELGFYPVVDSVKWLERLLPFGVRTAQLRIKDRKGAELEEEIKQAVALARRAQCRLFVNDYWELAVKHQAYGVHLGQEDIQRADIAAIEKAGLRLGISTHCYAEVARAHALQPSYMAIGPIFPTTLKSMKFAPQGVAMFRLWRQMLEYPLVAIGGITLESGQELLEAGADGIAVVSDISKNSDPEARAKAWLAKWPNPAKAKSA